MTEFWIALGPPQLKWLSGGPSGGIFVGHPGSGPKALVLPFYPLAINASVTDVSLKSKIYCCFIEWNINLSTSTEHTFDVCYVMIFYCLPSCLLYMATTHWMCTGASIWQMLLTSMRHNELIASLKHSQQSLTVCVCVQKYCIRTAYGNIHKIL